MFCTSMGISYPDPNNKICNLVDRTDSSNVEIDSKYVSEFNQALADDAVVVPFRHYGVRWLYSKKMDPKMFPATVVAPLFEELRFL